MDANHPFSFINLLLAFINRQISLPTMLLNKIEYPSFKNCYKYLLKSAIQKLAGQAHLLYITKKAPPPKKPNHKKYKQNKEKVSKKVSVPREARKDKGRSSGLSSTQVLLLLASAKDSGAERPAGPAAELCSGSSCYFNIRLCIGEVIKKYPIYMCASEASEAIRGFKFSVSAVSAT